MKSLLRSTFIAGPSDSKDAFLENYRTLDQSNFGFDLPEDVSIWNFVHEFVQQHRHVPDVSTVRAHFERNNDNSIVDRVDSVAQVSPRVKGDFIRRLEDCAEDRRKVLLGQILQEAGEIITKGVEVKEERGREKRILKGPVHAVRYLMDKVHDIVTPTVGSKLAGNVVADHLDLLAEYDRVKSDPLAGIGQFTGIKSVDEALKGAKRGELWTHAAFTGGLKCVAGDTRIFDVSKGRLRTAAEIHASGDAPVVHALDLDTGELRHHQASPVVANGVRPILRITTELWRTVRVSDNHPFLTPSGWVDAGKLAPGDWVAVVRPGHFLDDIDWRSVEEMQVVPENFPAYQDARWEQVQENAPDGEEMTYDLSVPGPANFVANGFITHNSTLMLNWAYNQSVHYKHSVLIISLEMPYDQCRRILYGLHSHHPKFKGIHAPIDYQRLRYGELTPDEELFLREHVAPDFGDKANGYGDINIEVADPERTEFGVADIRARAETIYAQRPFQLLFIDHALLVTPRKWVPSTTDRINEVIRDAKKLAMGFNKGQGLAVVLLFQISREGYRSAVKKREAGNPYIYDLTQLSYANECERSSDIVTATWLDDELAKNGQALLQCLKSRDQAPFKPCIVGITWATRRMHSLDDVSVEDVIKRKEEDPDAFDKGFKKKGKKRPKHEAIEDLGI